MESACSISASLTPGWNAGSFTIPPAPPVVLSATQLRTRPALALLPRRRRPVSRDLHFSVSALHSASRGLAVEKPHLQMTRSWWKHLRASINKLGWFRLPSRWRRDGSLKLYFPYLSPVYYCQAAGQSLERPSPSCPTGHVQR